MKWVPNAVTASRGLAGPLIFGLLWVGYSHWVAFALFIAAMLTDLVDGWLARKLDACSDYGEWLDPVSDKLLIDFTWLGVWAADLAPWYLALPMVVRDLSVAVEWHWFHARGQRFRSSKLGQVAVSFEGIALPVLLFHVVWIDIHWYSVGVMLSELSLALSAGAAFAYLYDGPQPHPEPGMNGQPWRKTPPSIRT